MLDNILMGPLGSLFSANHSKHFIGNSSAWAASYRHSGVIMLAYIRMSTKSTYAFITSGSKKGCTAWSGGVLRMAVSFTASLFFFSNWFCPQSSWFLPTPEFTRSSSLQSFSSDGDGNRVQMNLRADYPDWPLRLHAGGVIAVVIHVDCHAQQGSFLTVN